MHVDWKESDDIEWQANALLDARGISDRWTWDSEGKTVMQGLTVLSDWLRARQLCLISVDMDSDAYFMLIVGDNGAAQAVELGQRAGLDVMSFADFAVAQGAR